MESLSILGNTGGSLTFELKDGFKCGNDFNDGTFLGNDVYDVSLVSSSVFNTSTGSGSKLRDFNKIFNSLDCFVFWI